MSKVIFDISVSLDGFITAANQTPEQPMGDGGERLVEWAFGEDTADRELLERGVGGLGAVIAGRRTYDTSVPWWGANGPIGPARVPVVVLSHGTPDSVPDGGVYTFVNGVEHTLEQARAAAGDKTVAIMGGADTGRQFLQAGLVDELSLHVVPILLGAGTRLFDGLERPIELENAEAVQTAAATHLRWRIR